MNSFEMFVKDIFYLTDGRMVFSGKFVTFNYDKFPIDAVVYVNDRMVGNVQLTTIPFSVGKNVKKDVDVIEASPQIDLKFINWEKDVVLLRSDNKA